MDKYENKKVSYGLLMTTLVLGAFLATLATSTVNIALPSLMEQFNCSLDIVKWSITGFMLATGIIAPVTCYFGEKFSYKKLYLISIIGFMLTSILCALSWNVQSFILFRIIQGVFCGVIMPLTMTIIYQIIPREKQIFSISLWSMAASFAPAIGPTLSGWFVQNYSWKAIFIINIPMGIIAVLLIMIAIPQYKLNPPKGFDLVGFSTCLVASILLLTAFSEASQWGWMSKKTVLFLIFGMISLVAFIVREFRGKTPILNLRIFKNKVFTLSVIVRSIIIMGLYAGSLLTPLLLINVMHVSIVEAGMIMLPSSLVMVVFTLIASKLYHCIAPRILIAVGIILLAMGSFFLSKLSLETSYTYIIVQTIIRNIGVALSLGPISMLGMRSLNKNMTGDGSSVNNWISQSVGCLSIGIFTSLLTYQSNRHTLELTASGVFLKERKDLITNMSFVMGVNDVYLISVIILLIALPICIFLKNEESNENKYIQDESYSSSIANR